MVSIAMSNLLLIAPLDRWLRLLSLGLALGLSGGLLYQSRILHQRSLEPPTAIVVLGGGIQRETVAARLAQHYPHLPVIISSGSTIPCLYRVFVEENQVDWQRIKVDLRAEDTLTNFTSILPYLQAQHHKTVFLVTTSGHLTRSRMLAAIIWGSRGIAVRPQVMEGIGHNESWVKLLFDLMRAIAWFLFGDWIAQLFYRDPLELQQFSTQRQSRCEIGSATLPQSVDPALSILPQDL